MAPVVTKAAVYDWIVFASLPKQPGSYLLDLSLSLVVSLVRCLALSALFSVSGLRKSDQLIPL